MKFIDLLKAVRMREVSLQILKGKFFNEISSKEKITYMSLMLRKGNTFLKK